MKKIIILLLALLMSACSAVKPAETLSSIPAQKKNLLHIEEAADGSVAFSFEPVT